MKQVKTPKNGSVKKLVLNLTDELFEKIREKAHREKTSRSYFINQAILNELSKTSQKAEN